jgi:hypothetical protein
VDAFTQHLQKKTETELAELLDRDAVVPSMGQNGDGQVQAEEGVKNKTKEWGGPKGAEPTRFGDWEQKGRCTDF